MNPKNSPAPQTPKPSMRTAKAKVAPSEPSRIEKSKPTTPSESKIDTVVRLMRRPDGADLTELAAETGWQKHSVRGAIAGSLKKKLGLEVTTTKEPERGTVYRTPPIPMSASAGITTQAAS